MLSSVDVPWRPGAALTLRAGFLCLREVADRNQARLEAWGESDFTRGADTLDPSLVPEGLVYPLPVPDSFWFDVGPDLT
jgi:hypothetical protein